MKSFKTYFLLTKPGIVFGNAVTCGGGFALASKGEIDFWLLLVTLLGLSLIVASGCVSNNCIDRHSDAKMKRTQNRALVKGLISKEQALAFAILLLLCGSLVLIFLVNLLTALITLFGFLVYLVFYSFLKYHSVHGTLIGSIAGAVPPVAGYAAVTHSVDMGAFILFMMIAMWQMPHFYAIAVYRLEDYASASIPVLPLIRGMRTTKIQMLFYIIAFMGVSCLLYLSGYVEPLYLIVILFLGLIWLYQCMRGFKCNSDSRWARQMFVFSLIVVMSTCILIPFSVV